MRAGWIIKVWAVLLVSVSASLAETIPLDFFLGRIIGARQIELGFADHRDGLASFDLSIGAGIDNKFSLRAPKALNYSPRRDEQKWDLKKRVAGALQIGPLIRYSLGYLEYDHANDEFRSLGSNGAEKTIDWNLEHRLDYWSENQFEIDSQHVPYFLVERELLFDSRQHSIGILNRFLSTERLFVYSSYSSTPSGTRVGTYSSGSELSNFETQEDLRIGLGRGLVLNQRLILSRLRNRRQSRSDESSSSLTYAYSRSSSQSDISRETEVQVGIEKFWNSTCWGQLDLAFGRVRTPRESHDIGRYSTGQTSPFDARESETSSDHGQIAVTLNLLSQTEIKPVQFLLDRFNGYYGLELPPGTTNIEASLSWTINDQSHSYKRSDRDVDDSPEIFQSKVREHQLALSLAATHFLRRNLEGIASLSVLHTPNFNGAAEGDYANQESIIGHLSLGYRSYIWDSELRREISWLEVSAIDYLLGPLVRADDYRISIEVEPSFQELYPATFGVPTFRAFYSRRRAIDCTVALAGIHGLTNAIDIQGMLSYQLSILDYGTTEYERDYWNFEARLRWQPLKSLRISGQLATQVLYENSVVNWTLYIEEDSYTSTSWRCTVKCDLIL